MANVCRSPYGAAAIAHHLPQLVVESAGVEAAPGQPADPRMIELARLRGYRDLGTHRSRLLLSGIVSGSDLILCMETGHRDVLLSRFPRMTGRIRCFDDFPSRDVEDPTGRSEAHYGEAARLIDRLAAEWAAKIRRIL
jgi:protein-tyrosine phosphatase